MSNYVDNSMMLNKYLENISNNINLIRNNWQKQEVEELYNMPFNDLLYLASTMQRHFWPVDRVQPCTLLSIKTGSCPEDCKYCAQSAHYNTGLKKEPLMDIDKILEAAQKAKESGAVRFCMGAAWRCLHDRDLPKVKEIVEKVKAMGLETCMTLGMITANQAQELAESGLDYYNHNVDTSEEYYNKIITTRSYQDRLETLDNVRSAGINVCSGGILGMGESTQDRVSMLCTLANLEKHPESVPINTLYQIEGTPLYGVSKIDSIDFIKTVALARIMMPKTFIRLSAGRTEMSDEMQAMCMFAGANSIHYGETLLTQPNQTVENDQKLFNRLGIKLEQIEIPA